MAVERIPEYTVAEYLSVEQGSEEKHEYLGGQIYAMSGATKEHVRIVTDIVVALGSQLRGRPCEPFGTDMRVRTAAEGLYTYPDVTVVCGRAVFGDGDTLTNPTLLVEVLSESTERYDRGAKFRLYQAIESLQEYVLVAQDRPRVEVFRRAGDGSWRYRAVEGLDAAAELDSIGCVLRLADVYARVSFEDTAEAEAAEAAPRDEAPR